jgi:23S rRNA (adenine2030-N6)-methyltransferase
MNYRHAYHAGNFADLFKHAVLLALLGEFRRSPKPFTVIDTHGGAGVYDLGAEAARRTGEGEAAVRLMEVSNAPKVFEPLKADIGRLNRGGPTRGYPGSPWLIGSALRKEDRALACEVRADDAASLSRAVSRFGRLEVVTGDGWKTAVQRAPRAPSPLLVLIDPPFEAHDDGVRAADALARILSRNPTAVVAVWTPIKDLAGFDTLLGDLEDAAGGRPVLVREVRLRPLDDPMRLNGCAMIIANPPAGLDAAAREAAVWIELTFGDRGGRGSASLGR